MTNFEMSKSGIIKPKPKRVPCGYCSRTIKQEHQPNEKINSLNGLPICQACLIKKKSKHGNTIERDKQRYEKDKKKAINHYKKRRAKENKEKVERVAAESVKNFHKDKK